MVVRGYQLTLLDLLYLTHDDLAKAFSNEIIKLNCNLKWIRTTEKIRPFSLINLATKTRGGLISHQNLIHSI